jgi:hypothetical protein
MKLLLLLLKKIMKLSEVVKEGARDARMVGFNFNNSCLFFIFICIYIVYGQEVCFILSFFVKNSLSVLQLFLLSILNIFINK